MEEVHNTNKYCSRDRAIASLGQQLAAANAEIATLRHDLLNEQAASRMAHEVVARNRALEAENAQLRHALANAQVAAGFAKEFGVKCKELQERSAIYQLDLHELRKVAYRIGKDFVGNEHDEVSQIMLGQTLIAESRLCKTCDGTGEDGDPEDGKIYSCPDCNGTGVILTPKCTCDESVGYVCNQCYDEMSKRQP